MRVIVWRRSRLRECCWRIVQLAVVLLLLVVLVVPLRNIVFCAFLPGLWREHSSLFLIKVMFDSQDFPVEDTPIESSPIKLAVNFNDITNKFQSAVPRYSTFYQEVHQLRKMSGSQNMARQSELQTLLNYEPVMTKEDRAILFFTLDVFMRACEAANLTYFLISGSLLGALRHHGMIPWDDDLDIAMNASEWYKIRNVLSNVEGFELYAPAKVQWKFFMKSLKKRNRPFKWPNVDIFFFNEDDTHIWAVTSGAKGSLCSKKSTVLPLSHRKFELWNMPVPRMSTSLAASEFGDYHASCATSAYDHISNRGLRTSHVLCQRLHKVYLFVFLRSGSVPRTILEMKMVNGMSVDNITLPEEI